MIGGLGKNWWSVFYDCWSTKDITREPVNRNFLGWQIRRDISAALDENGREV
jgi:hypothetical protein